MKSYQNKRRGRGLPLNTRSQESYLNVTRRGASVLLTLSAGFRHLIDDEDEP